MSSPYRPSGDSTEDEEPEQRVVVTRAKTPARTTGKTTSKAAGQLQFPYLSQPNVVMECYGRRHNITLPSPQMMQQAYLTACRARERELPDAVKEAKYTGVDLDNVASSTDLVRSADAGQIAGADCYFDDFLQAEFFRGALRPDKRFPDQTVPLTTPAQKGHVQLLVQAFNNFTNCDDNTQMVRPFKEKRHDPKLVEVLCWGLLKACMMRSLSEEPLLTAYEPLKSRNSPGVSTFAERFDEMVKSLTRSKTICKHLYDPPYINVFVDDPVRAIRRVDANRDLNRQKGQIMGKGKKLFEEEKKAKGETPVPRSRKRRAITAPDDDDYSPSVENTPVRRSLIVKLPIDKTPRTQATASQQSSSDSDDGFSKPLTPPKSAAFMVPMSSPMPMFKQEDESPRRPQAMFRGQNQQNAFYNHNSLGNTSSYLNPRQSYDYGYSSSMAAPSAASHVSPYASANANSYGVTNQTPYANSYGMQGMFTNEQLRQQQAAYAWYQQQVQQQQWQQQQQQAGFAYGPTNPPMSNRATFSTATTPSMPGFISGAASSTATAPTTPSTHGFVIPAALLPRDPPLFPPDNSENVPAVPDNNEMADEAEFPDAEGEADEEAEGEGAEFTLD